MAKSREWRGKFQTLTDYRNSVPEKKFFNPDLTKTRTGIREIRPLKHKPDFGYFGSVLPASVKEQPHRKTVKRTTMLNARLF